MKVFKLLSMALIAISIITSFTACNNDEEPVVPPITNITIVTPNPKIGRSNNSLRYSHKPSKKAFIV